MGIRNGGARLDKARFGNFVVDRCAGELRKNGIRVKLRDQAFEVLTILLERAGEVVTREELQQKLWPADSLVDFDHGLNKTINRIREALSDSALTPRFLETLPRRGYRFIAPVEEVVRLAAPPEPPVNTPLPPTPDAVRVPLRRRYWLWASCAALVALAAAAVTAATLLRPKPPLPRPTLAVLPFANLSPEPDSDYFSDGLTEELIYTLGRTPGLRVISHTSSFALKGKGLDLRETANRLGATVALEGSVTKSAGRVKVRAQLLEVAGERKLWSQTYERNIGDILAIQDNIASAVAGHLIDPMNAPHKAGTGTANAAAHDAYWMGTHFLNRLSRDAAPRAKDYFEQALRLDPQYADAHAGLSRYYEQARWLRLMPSKEAILLQAAAAQRSVELNDELPEAHVALGEAKNLSDQDWNAGEREFRLAISLNPSYVPARQFLMFQLTHLGRKEEALQEAAHALELDPLSVPLNEFVAETLFVFREYDRAFKQAKKGVEMDPSFARGYHSLARCYLKQGAFDKAIEAFGKEEELGHGFRPALLGYAYALGGRRADALKYIREEETIRRDENIHALAIAQTYLGLGDKNSALNWLEKAYQEDPNWLGDLAVRPELDSLRQEPRFQQLLKRLGLPGN